MDSQELHIACLTVQRAALVTRKLLEAVDKGILDKNDSTPVTLGDFAAQALIISALHHVFPDDKFVGEEDSHALRADEGLLNRTWELVSTTHLDGEELYTPSTKEEMLDLIDLGRGECKTDRTWILDPIDGTATFMNGQQYAVCLALVVDGCQQIGVLGCPNLNLSTGRVHEDIVDRDGYGYQLYAVSGSGAGIRQMGNGALLPGQRIERKSAVSNPSELQFVDCGHASSTDSDLHGQIARRMEAPWPNVTDVWAAQMRYVALAVGGCNAVIKIPRNTNYRSKLWDHAGGMLIAEEVGLVVTDVDGERINCACGRSLGCFGMIVAPPSIHPLVVETVRQVRQGQGQGI